VTTTRSVFAVLGLDYTGELVVRADKPGDVSSQPAELERARAIGASLATAASERATGL
jgi:hypothetical protein